MSDYINEVFGPSGLLAAELDNYEMRPGQVELARAFERAIAEERDLVAEGPTGVGKSFAYLVPATRISAQTRKKVLVVTSGIALQEQLISKDLPLLRKILPWSFSFGLLKGRTNYLCRHKHGEVRDEMVWRGPDPAPKYDQPQKFQRHFDEISTLVRWSESTRGGDKSDLETDPACWFLFSSSHEECLGRACPEAKRCCANIARRVAMSANVVVTNYHLRLIGGGVVAPDHDVMICDEAHELPDIARGVLGWSLSPNTLNRVAHWCRRSAPAAESTEWGRLANGLAQASGRFFEAVISEVGTRSIHQLVRPGWVSADELHTLLSDVSNRASGRAEDFAGRGEDVRAKRAEQMASRAFELAVHARECAQLKGEDWVYWLTRGAERHRYTVEARPLVVSGILRDMLFDVRSVGMISATMTSGGSFKYVRDEIGVPDAAGELIAPSPFNLREQGVLVIPSGIPAPPRANDEDAMIGWQAEVAGCAADLIEMCGGRSLLLFTSWRNLNYVRKELKSYATMKDIRFLCQGDMPKTRLLEEFKRDERSVLLGVASFWTGVDVPGRSLTGLLIDKLPFPVPTDPVNKAMDALLKRQGRNAFMERAIPQATIALRQGIGRLIRTADDVGVAVIADTRLYDKPYGAMIRASLPEFLDTRDIEVGFSFMEDRGWV